MNPAILMLLGELQALRQRILVGPKGLFANKVDQQFARGELTSTGVMKALQERQVAINNALIAVVQLEGALIVAGRRSEKSDSGAIDYAKFEADRGLRMAESLHRFDLEGHTLYL